MSSEVSIGAEKLRAAKTPSDYIDEVKGLLGKNNRKDAYRVLINALGQYPENPFLLSYYGYLEAVLNKNYKDGIRICTRAIEILKQKTPFGEEFFYPFFYLNLGRVYLIAGKKKNAIDVFDKGLRIDSEDSALLHEMKKLGIRKKPIVPLFDRSNPMNKYIGMFLRKLKK